MSYFAALLTRTENRWEGADLDLLGVADLDALTELLHEAAGDGADRLALLFVEEDDEWVGIVRVQDVLDPKVFISDRRAIQESHIAALLYQPPPAEVPDPPDDEERARVLSTEPAGETDLLDDLGVSGEQLEELCAEEGLLPADVVTAVCEQIGCLDALERARGA